MARFGSSKVGQLRIIGSGSPDAGLVHQAFLLVQDLHTLTLCEYKDQHIVIHVLSPQFQTSSIAVCPKLDEPTLRPEESAEKSMIQTLAVMAAPRSLGSKGLKTIRILKGRDQLCL